MHVVSIYVLMQFDQQQKNGEYVLPLQFWTLRHMTRFLFIVFVNITTFLQMDIINQKWIINFALSRVKIRVIVRTFLAFCFSKLNKILYQVLPHVFVLSEFIPH